MAFVAERCTAPLRGLWCLCAVCVDGFPASQVTIMNIRKAVSVFIVEDHEITRKGMELLLKEHADEIELVGSSGDGAEALEKITELKPDVVLMDIRVPAVDGLSATYQIKERLPDTKVVILTSFAEGSDIFRAF